MRIPFKLSFLKYSSPMIQKIEQAKIQYYASRPPYEQPVFIVGAPRTGSTILYQLISNNLNVLYINNLVDLFYRNIFFGFWLSQKFLGQEPHNCFVSNLGDTKSCGLRGPSECGDFWYRWLQRDRHFIDTDDFTKKTVEEMRESIFSVINKYKKPFLFKNLNAGQRMRLISKIAPNAKFIFMKREPLFTAQSIFRSKQRIGLKPDDWWSIKPENHKQLSLLNPYEQIVRQIYFLEKQIVLDSSLYPEENFMTVHYKDLCNDYTKVLDSVHSFIGNDIGYRENLGEPDIHRSERRTIDDIHLERFQKEIEKLDWCNYES